jgi:hypothetical protein
VAIEGQKSMGSNDFDNRFPHVAARIRRYFRQHPGVAREKFFLDAVRREICFRERKSIENRAEHVLRKYELPHGRLANPLPPTAKDIFIHGMLAERVAFLHNERYGLWPMLRRFLCCNRLIRSLGLQPRRATKK